MGKTNSRNMKQGVLLPSISLSGTCGNDGEERTGVVTRDFPISSVFTPLPVDANAFSRQTRSCVCVCHSFLLVAPFAFSIPFHTQLDNLSFFFASCFLLLYS